MEKNKLELINSEIIAAAVIKSELIDIDDNNASINVDEQIKELRVLGSVLLSDNIEDRIDLQNIFWKYSKYIRFKIKLAELITSKKD